MDFDRRLLDQTAARHELVLPPVSWRCAMKAEADNRGAGWSKLEDAAHRYQVPMVAPHNALSDAQTTLGGESSGWWSVTENGWP